MTPNARLLSANGEQTDLLAVAIMVDYRLEVRLLTAAKHFLQ